MTTSAKPLYILNGPNLNRLGQREPDIYGKVTLGEVEAHCRSAAGDRPVEFRQSNSEAQLIDWIHEALGRFRGIVINPGAYTHTSIALHDAIRAVGLPTIELHLSNVFAREDFRHHSYVSPVAAGVICGFGAAGYGLALQALQPLVE